MIFVTSDLHLYHAREFVYKPRGFDNVHDMNEAICNNWNRVVGVEDDVYLLGDVMLNNNEAGIKLLKSLKGKIHIIIGNHDTDSRVALYKDCWNVEEVVYATKIKYNGYHFYMSHYPTYTGNLNKERLKQMTCCLYGHTHQTTNFFNDIPFMYHVGVDSHNCTPVLLDDVIVEMEKKCIECKEML